MEAEATHPAGKGGSPRDHVGHSKRDDLLLEYCRTNWAAQEGEAMVDLREEWGVCRISLFWDVKERLNSNGDQYLAHLFQ